MNHRLFLQLLFLLHLLVHLLLQYNQHLFDEVSYRGYEIKRQNKKVDGLKQHPLIVPTLRLAGTDMKDIKRMIDRYLDEDAPANATGTAVAGTGDDSSTVVVKKKKPLQDKLMKRMGIKEAIDRAVPDLEYPKDEITERKQQLIDMAKKHGENI